MRNKKNKKPKYLFFKMSTIEFCLPLQQIIIIEKANYNHEGLDERIRIIPSLPIYCKGVYILKKDIIPVIDLELLLLQQPVTPHKENKIIFVKHEDKKIGLLVDDVMGISELKDVETIEKLDDKSIFSLAEESNQVIIIPDLSVLLKKINLYEQLNSFDFQEE